MSPSESAQLAEFASAIRSDIRELRETLSEHMREEAATSAKVTTKLDDIAERVGTLEKRERDELEARAEKAEGRIEASAEKRESLIAKVGLVVLGVVLTAAASAYITHSVGRMAPPASAASK